jgi:F-type H+-transporting ATPase subunit b
MKSISSRAIFASLWLALPTALWAAGGGEQGESGGNIFGGDLGNAIWTLVVFGVLYLVLSKFAWPKILDGLQERENFIRESLDKAKNDRDEAKAILERYEGKLAEARAEATKIVDEGRRDAEVVKQRIEQKAREESDKTLERAKREIGIAKETAIKELYTLSGRLATDIASKIVERELKPEDHEKLVRQALAQLNEQAN